MLRTLGIRVSHVLVLGPRKSFCLLPFLPALLLETPLGFHPEDIPNDGRLSVTDYRLSSRSVGFLRNGFLVARLILLHTLSKLLRCRTVTWICRVQAQACPMDRA